MAWLTAGLHPERTAPGRGPHRHPLALNAYLNQSVRVGDLDGR